MLVESAYIVNSHTFCDTIWSLVILIQQCNMCHIFISDKGYAIESVCESGCVPVRKRVNFKKLQTDFDETFCISGNKRSVHPGRTEKK